MFVKTAPAAVLQALVVVRWDAAKMSAVVVQATPTSPVPFSHCPLRAWFTTVGLTLCVGMVVAQFAWAVLTFVLPSTVGYFEDNVGRGCGGVVVTLDVAAGPGCVTRVCSACTCHCRARTCL